jgi:hypothetical protein
MATFPSDTTADGIWTFKKQKRAQQGGDWPTIALPSAADYSLYSNSFATGSTSSQASSGEGSYVDTNGVWAPTFSTFTENVAWNSGGYMELNSRTVPAARFYFEIPAAYLNNYRYVSFISTMYVLSNDGFGTAIGIQDDRASQYDNLISSFRVNRSVVGGQSGVHMYYANPTEASSSWDDSGGFNWYTNQLQVQYWFDTSNNTGKLIIGGYDCVDVGVGDAPVCWQRCFLVRELARRWAG